MKNGILIELIKLKPSIIDWENLDEVNFLLSLPNNLCSRIVKDSVDERTQIINLLKNKEAFGRKGNYECVLDCIKAAGSYINNKNIIEILKLAQDKNIQGMKKDFYKLTISMCCYEDVRNFNFLKDVVTHELFPKYIDKNNTYKRSSLYLMSLLACMNSEQAIRIITNPHIKNINDYSSLNVFMELLNYKTIYELPEEDLEKILGLFDKKLEIGEHSHLNSLVHILNDEKFKSDFKYRSVLNLLSKVSKKEQLSAFMNATDWFDFRNSKHYYFILSLIVNTQYGYEIINDLIRYSYVLNLKDFRWCMSQVDFSKPVFGFSKYAKLISYTGFKCKYNGEKKRKEAIKVVSKKLNSEKYIDEFISFITNEKVIDSIYYEEYINTASKLDFRNISLYRYIVDNIEKAHNHITLSDVELINSLVLKDINNVFSISYIFDVEKITQSESFQNIILTLFKKTYPISNYIEIINSPVLINEDNYIELVNKVISINDEEYIKYIRGLSKMENPYNKYILYGLKTKNVNKLKALYATIYIHSNSNSLDDLDFVANNIVKDSPTLAYKVMYRLFECNCLKETKVNAIIIAILARNVTSLNKFCYLLEETAGDEYKGIVDRIKMVLLKKDLNYNQELSLVQNKYISYLEKCRAFDEVDTQKFTRILKVKA